MSIEDASGFIDALKDPDVGGLSEAEAEETYNKLSQETKEKLNGISRDESASILENIKNNVGSTPDNFANGTDVNGDVTRVNEKTAAVDAAAAKSGPQGAIEQASQTIGQTPAGQNMVDDLANATNTPEGEAKFRSDCNDPNTQQTAKSFIGKAGNFLWSFSGLSFVGIVVWMVATGTSPADLIKQLLINPLLTVAKETIGALEGLGKEFIKDTSGTLGEGAKIAIIVVSVAVGVGIIAAVIGVGIKKGWFKKKPA